MIAAGRALGCTKAGYRAGAYLAVSSFVLAVAFRALARQHGWGVPAPLIASVTISSGPAQFALVIAPAAVIASAAGDPAWAVVTAAGLLNLRFLPMALVVAP